MGRNDADFRGLFEPCREMKLIHLLSMEMLYGRDMLIMFYDGLSNRELMPVLGVR